MDSKSKFIKGVLVGVLVTAFAGLIVVGLAAGILMFGRNVITNKELAQGIETQIVEDEEVVEGLDINQISAKMQAIQSIIDNYYLFDEDLDKVQEGIYTGMMYGLEDPYSVYYSKEDYQKLIEDTEGTYCGIGAMITQDRKTGIITVFKVFKGSPSFEAGLQPEDILYTVDDEEVTGEDLDLLVQNRIRGEEGTTVNVTVLRGENNEEVDLVIERRQIIVPTIEHKLLEDNLGYISILQFDTVTSDQFKEAIDDLEAQGMEKLIIDLRGNPGGVLDAAVDMMAYVLPEGMLIYTEDKNGQGDQYFSKDGKIQSTSDVGTPSRNYPKPDDHEVNVPMAVLVNGNSASASEVFAGAMKDYEKAIIVGTTTFGKGIVQQVIPLGDDTAIKITISHYFTPNGNDVHEKGVEPDIEVDLDEELKTKAVVELEEDNQFQAAVEALK